MNLACYWFCLTSSEYAWLYAAAIRNMITITMMAVMQRMRVDRRVRRGKETIFTIVDHCDSGMDFLMPGVF